MKGFGRVRNVLAVMSSVGVVGGVWYWKRTRNSAPGTRVSIGLSDGSLRAVDPELREELIATAEAVVGDERALARLRAARKPRSHTRG